MKGILLKTAGLVSLVCQGSLAIDLNVKDERMSFPALIRRIGIYTDYTDNSGQNQ